MGTRGYILACALLVAAGCGLTLETSSPQTRDAHPPADSATGDTGVPDTSAPDTGVPDTGAPDTGAPDTGGGDTGVIRDGGAVDAAVDAIAPCPADCDDDNECTVDTCAGGVCVHGDLDGDACAPDGACELGQCEAGACVAIAAMTCPEPMVCDPASGGCVCPFADLRVCGPVCISLSTCCDDGDCDAPFVCPGPGGSCSCPVGQRPCGGRCIPATDCCSSSDCPSGATCSPTGRCDCPAGTVSCGGGGCVPTTTACTPGTVDLASCGSRCLRRVCDAGCTFGACELAPGAECGREGAACVLGRCGVCTDCGFTAIGGVLCSDDTECAAVVTPGG